MEKKAIYIILIKVTVNVNGGPRPFDWRAWRGEVAAWLAEWLAAGMAEWLSDYVAYCWDG